MHSHAMRTRGMETAIERHDDVDAKTGNPKIKKHKDSKNTKIQKTQKIQKNTKIHSYGRRAHMPNGYLQRLAAVLQAVMPFDLQQDQHCSTARRCSDGRVSGRQQSLKTAAPSVPVANHNSQAWYATL